jgi:hypothetical protein
MSECREKIFIQHNESLLDAYKYLNEMGISYFSHGFKYQENDVSVFFTNEDWAQTYLNKNYLYFDPLLQNVRDKHIPLVLWDTLPLEKAEKEIMIERYEVCKIKSGFTIGLTRPDQFEIFALGSSLKDPDFSSNLCDYKYCQQLYKLLNDFSKKHKTLYMNNLKDVE